MEIVVVAAVVVAAVGIAVEAAMVGGVDEGESVGDSSPALLFGFSLLESLNRRKKSNLGGVPYTSEE